MAMTMVAAVKRDRSDGNRWYWAYIVSDESVSEGDYTGADVEGANDDARFVAGSMIRTPSGMMDALSDGHFVARG